MSEIIKKINNVLNESLTGNKLRKKLNMLETDMKKYVNTQEVLASGLLGMVRDGVLKSKDVDKFRKMQMDINDFVERLIDIADSGASN